MRTNRREFCVKKEVDAGQSVAPMAITDVPVRIRVGDTPAPDYDEFDAQELQSTSSKRPIQITKRVMGFNISHLLRGSGAVATPPIISDLLEMGMLLKEVLRTVPIGAITNGPYLDGALFTGLTSGAVGRVFRTTTSGAAALLYVVVSGTVSSGEILRVGAAGAQATTSAVSAVAGTLYKLTDSDFVDVADTKHHCTCELRQDGFYWRGRGMLSDVSFAFRNGQPCIVSHAIIGALDDQGDEPLFGLTAFPQESVPAARFLDAGIKIGAYQPTDVVDFSLALKSNPEVREDANDDNADGVLFADYDREAPIITFDPAMVKAATFDYFNTLFDGTTFAMEWQLGTVAGNKWRFFADECQFVRVGADARRQLATAPLEVRLNGNNNNELYIWHS